MSRSSVLSGFHPYGGAATAAAPFDSSSSNGIGSSNSSHLHDQQQSQHHHLHLHHAAGSPSLPLYRPPLPIRAPDLLPAAVAYQSQSQSQSQSQHQQQQLQQHQQLQQRQRQHSHNHTLTLAHTHTQTQLQQHLRQQHQHNQHNNHHQHPTGHNGRPATSLSMSAAPTYTMPDDDDFAQLQKLSNEYQPEATGPLVGERQSSSAIATEYANADPVYRIKTAALPQKYAYFRTCRGDGHCGWRAIAFTYFEALLRPGDVNRFEDEEVRLQSMGNLLAVAGFPDDIIEDFRDDTFQLLRRLDHSERAMDGTAADILLSDFNDFGISMSVITYFKLLTSAWIQANPNDFLPFLLDCPDLKMYCQHNIEAAGCEIDHVSMAALAEVLVKPAGFGLEVLYLDRSQGSEINNTYRVEPTGHDGLPQLNAPVMRLLYRPGHYDILYKAEDFPPPVPQAPLQVALAGYTDEFVPMASNFSDVMTMIPGLVPTGLGPRWSSVSYYDNPTPAPQPQINPVQTYVPTPSPVTAVASSHADFTSPVHASHASHHHPPSHHGLQLERSVTLPIHHAPPPPPPINIERAPSMSAERGGPFRPSMYELEPGFGAGQVHSLPFQTSIFRNSHYNTAHFLNPEFQPEEWSPDSEYATGNNRGRHKSTSS